MICLRSGYCCIHLDVVIVDDPAKGIVEGNLKHKPSGKICQHLQGYRFNHSCDIHDEPWFKSTPCAEYTQVENGNTECRTGAYMRDKK